jgi:hypothetical protein
MLASTLKNNPLLLLAVIGKVLAGNKYDCYYVYPIFKIKTPKLNPESECCNSKNVKCNMEIQPPIVTELKLSKQQLKITPNQVWNLKGLEKL